MSDISVTTPPATIHLSAAERDWIRRQARCARALEAEQHRWVLRAASRTGVSGTTRASARH